jgi:hypothetical protein
VRPQNEPPVPANKLDRLAVRLQVKRRRDECGYPALIGKRGSILERGPDEWQMWYYGSRSIARAIGLCRSLGGTVRQRGDHEVSFSVPWDSEITDDQVLQIRKLLKLRKRRVLSPTAKIEAVERVLRFRFAKDPKSPEVSERPPQSPEPLSFAEVGTASRKQGRSRRLPPSGGDETR